MKPAERSLRPNTKFAVRREATRQELLRLGLTRFPLKGYSSTTIDDLVRDSGYTRGAFYFHFPGKEDFFLELLRTRAELRDEWWRVARDPGIADLREAIVATLAHLDTREDGGAWLLLIADFFQTVHEQPEYVEQLRELYQQWLVELGAFVAVLRERGFARTDLADRALGAEIFATVEGHTIHRALYEMPATGLVDMIVRQLQP
ncbi:MAG: TetR family transcriptional regulator [Leucobacter sp.]|nr:TetR family transcriptional regulator [Leucobacter sp.]